MTVPIPSTAGPLKTILVLGSAYAGNRSVQTVVDRLSKVSWGDRWRVLVLDRSTHFCHIYAFPRVSILPSHEQKTFIPNTTIFHRGPEHDSPLVPYDSPEGIARNRHQLLHGVANWVSDGKCGYSPFVSKEGGEAGLEEGDEQILDWDYMIYALGAKYPSPINVWTRHRDAAAEGSKAGVKGLVHQHEVEPEDTTPHAAVNGNGPSTNGHAHHVHEVNPDSAIKAPVVKSNGHMKPSNGVVETTESTGTKVEGIAWMQAAQERIRQARKILVVGGGALGVQMATDIIATHGLGSKDVTLLHSRAQLLNRFDKFLHDHTVQKCEEFGIEVILGDRIRPEFVNKSESGLVKTVGGKEIEADLILWCTGQSPNTAQLQSAYPTAINPYTGLATVNRHLQLAAVPASASTPVEGPQMKPSEDPAFNILNKKLFIVGDCADAFGALNAGHTAWAQGQLAAVNLIQLVQAEEEGIEPVLEEYVPPTFGIKVSLGREFAVAQHAGNLKTIGKEMCADDLNTGVMWDSRQLSTENFWL